MSNFVRDNLSPPATKTDLIAVPGGADPTRYWAAADANYQAQIDSDLRGEIIAAQMHGLQNNPSVAASPSSGVTKIRSNNGYLEVSPNGNPFVQLDVVAMAKQYPGNASTLPSNTLTPDLSKGQLFFTKLDHNATVANPINTTQAQTGSVVRVYMQQDGTGGRSLAWGANFKGTGRYVPRQGAGLISRFDFLVNGDGTYTVLGADATDLAKAISPRDFGAIGDRVTDDTAAIAACYAYCKTFTPPLPMVLDGFFSQTSAPLIVDTDGSQIIGLGKDVSGIDHLSGYYGPDVIFVPSVWAQMPTRAALATGSGVAMQLDGTGNYWLNVSDNHAFNLNGLGQVCIEFYCHLDSMPPVQANLFTSQGVSPLSGDVNQSCFQIYAEPATLYGGPSGQWSISAKLNIGGTVYSVIPGFSAIYNSTASTHHVAITYDGSTMRVFVDGVMQGSTPATGTLVHKAYEDATLGPSMQLWPEQSVDADMITGAMDSVRVSNTARYTTGFTAPTAKFASDSNTILLHNFDNETRYCSRAKIGPPGSLVDTWIPLRRVGAGSGAGPVLRDFRLTDHDYVGGGAWIFEGLDSHIKDLWINDSAMPLRLDQNAFNCTISDVHLNGGGPTGSPFFNPRIGAYLGAYSGAGSVTNLHVVGYTYQVVAFPPGWTFGGKMYFLPSNMSAYCFIGTNSNLVDGLDATALLNNFIIDDENASNLQAAVLLANQDSTTIVGGDFSMSTYGANAIQVDGGRTITCVGTAFGGKSGGNPLFAVLNNAPSAPIQILAGQRYKTVLPWIVSGSEYLVAVQEKGVAYNVRPPRVAVADANYTATFADTIIGHTTLTAARADTIPTPVPLAAGHRFVFKDESGQAGTYNITITPASGTIDGASSVTINSNYGSVVIYTDGANYFTE